MAEAVARCEAAGELDRATLNAVLAEHHAAAASESEAAKQSDGKENAGEAKAETKKDAGPTKARIATRAFRVSAALWKSLEDPLGLLRRRDQTGSPHPERVASLLDALGDRTKTERARAAECTRRIDAARRETDRATQSLLANRKK